MPKQGLSKDIVVQAAVELMEEQGLARFSMSGLARRLQIKTASLYNHVESLGQLLELVGAEAVHRLVRLENQAVAGKQGDAALFALAKAYRMFAKEHTQLYRVIMAFPKWDNPTLEEEAGEIVEPFLRVLSDYGLTEEQQYHWQRGLRALMSGFAFHEQAGGFARFPVDVEESFQIAIRSAADGLRRAGGDGL
jgi:AcrR family transcriptional regulator